MLASEVLCDITLHALLWGLAYKCIFLLGLSSHWQTFINSYQKCEFDIFVAFLAFPMITTRCPFLTLGTSLSISKKVQLRCWPSSPVSSKFLLLLLNLAAPPEDSISVPRVPCTLKSTGQGRARPAHSFT